MTHPDIETIERTGYAKPEPMDTRNEFTIKVRVTGLADNSEAFENTIIEALDLYGFTVETIGLGVELNND